MRDKRPAEIALLKPRACSRAARRAANYCAVVVRSVVLPDDGLCCAGLALPAAFLVSFLASGLPSICLASAVLAAPLCLLFFLLGSYSGRAAGAAICSAGRGGAVETPPARTRARPARTVYGAGGRR